MYLDYYKLKEKPFQISSDPRFLWFGEKHKEALAVMKYGIQDNRGFLLLTGDVGTGKTTLINALVNNLGDNVIVVTVPNPDLEPIDFFNYVAVAFNMKKTFASKGSFLIYFSQFLKAAYQKKKKVLLIVDEAQRLSWTLLEEIRLLSNIEEQHTKLINIFFVGQNEFREMLMQNRSRALRQRITINFHLVPLNESETYSYIWHRLTVAGQGNMVFSLDAVTEIFRFSNGYPRLINIICDHALLTGFVKEKKEIDRFIIKECAKELIIESAYEKEHPTVSKAMEDPPQARMTTPEKIEEPDIIGQPDTREPALTVSEPLDADQKPRTKNTVNRFIIGAIILIVAILVSLHILKPEWTTPYLQKAKKVVVESAKSNKDPNSNGKSGLPENKKSSGKVHSFKITADPAGVAPPKASEPGKTANAESSRSDKGASADTIKRLPTIIEKTADGRYVFYRKTIRFDHNSNELPTRVYPVLDKIASLARKYAQSRIAINGYTDNTGDEEYNVMLSKFRANDVKAYIVGAGVLEDRIDAAGLGPKNPIADNNTVDGRITNRRVEIEMFIDSGLN